jgi:hypothetical protein
VSSFDRIGTTLSEVLVSLLVMSIGVVSLATLFPISVLRSVQATHLTNSTNLRYNVEALLSVRPQLYTIGAPWVAGGTYNQGDLITPTELTSLKSPPVVFYCSTAGTAGTQEPTWDLGNGNTTTETTGTGVQWITYRLQNYIIDPMGKWKVESAFRTIGNEDFFGNDGTSPRAVQLPSGAFNIRAFPGLGAGNVNLASEVGTLPDSWLLEVESNAVTNITSTSCDLIDQQIDITSTLPVDATGAYPQSRIVLFDGTGKYSEVRPINAVSNLSGATTTVSWPAFAGPLSITPVRARVERREERYTWLLSVRRGFSGTSFLDVVVFFRRPFSAKDEQVYPATFTATMDPGADGNYGNWTIDDDGNGTTDDASELGWAGSDDAPRNWVVIQYDDATGEKPFYKKGGFVTDADGLRWYRIIDVVEGGGFDISRGVFYGHTPEEVMFKAGLKTVNSTPAGVLVADNPYTSFAQPKAVLLKVENKILQSGPPVDSSTGQPQGRAMMMRGVVDVYPIRTKLTWED